MRHFPGVPLRATQAPTNEAFAKLAAQLKIPDILAHMAQNPVLLDIILRQV